jgi:hypothetical protein
MSQFFQHDHHRALADFFITLEAAEELAKLEQRQQAENAEHFEKFKEEHRKQTDEDISKLKQKLKNDAAEELAKYKETAYREAAKAATAAMTAEFERSDRIREIDAAKELAKMKKDLETEAVQELSNLKSWLQIKSTQELGRIRAEIVAKSNKVLEEVLAEHNRDFQARMEQNTKNLTIFSKKWYIESTGVGNVPLHLTPSAAVKLLANTPYVLSRYRDLCSDALVKYKKDLKAQYQNHLNDIELECRQWLKANAGSGLKVDVLDGLEMTINKGKAVDFHLNFNLKSKRGIQNLHGRITQEDLEQELKEISADYEDQLRKGALEGGLGLPQVKTQDQTLDLSIQVRILSTWISHKLRNIQISK